MFDTIIAVIGGLALFSIIIYVDFRVVGWIIDGGLKTFRRRLFLIYLPIALWCVCFCAIFIYPPLVTAYGSGEPVSFAWLQSFFMILNAFYAIGFALYIMAGPIETHKDKVEIWGASICMMLMLVVPVIKTIRFNLTSSMPRGIYIMQLATENPQRGDLVTFCLELNNPFTAVAREREYIGSGTCPSGLKPFLKRLAGLSGDVLEVSLDGIILNGSYLTGTARPEYDSLGRPVPPSLLKDGPIPAGMALVISQQHSGSFDSRHFGLVPYDSLTKVTPVLTDKEISPDVASD